MALNVDPGELAAAASQLAALAQATHESIPQSWVLPAGAEQISAEHVPQLNGQAADLFNRTAGLLHEIHNTAYKIGASAAGYTQTDDEDARTIGGSGGGVLSNPVDLPQAPGPRQPPTFSLPDVAAVDPLLFAEQLRAGLGPGPAANFASNVREYLAGSHLPAMSGLDQAARTMQDWTPVGTDAAAELDRHRSGLDELSTLLSQLADGADNYGDAFTTAKAQHPTPEEIIAARKELLSAIRSKNQLGVEDALAKFQEQNARSAATIAGYSAKVNSGSGNQSSSSAGTSGTSGGSSDASALTSMLPMLTSMMSGQNGLNSMNSANQDNSGAADDLGSLNDSLGNMGGFSGYGGDGSDPGASVPSADDVSDAENATIAGPMPLASDAAAAAVAGMATAPVAESLQSATAATAARPAAANGSPYMPYMPMSGMGQTGAGSNNERNRVVAWHPDRLMYVDDTPHTELVIGEKPTIAPSVTPPTPANPNSTPAGGSS